MSDLKFAHLTTRDGLALDNVVSILQDRRGFMWFATGDGLNRYDGHSFVVYKNNPRDPLSLSANYIRDLLEDDQGNLWLVVHPGINKFDPTTERTTRYSPDPKNPNSLSGHAAWSIARDSRGHLWIGMADTGLDRFDPATQTFTHYAKDSDGQPVGWITRLLEDRRGDIWFVGDRGLFRLRLENGRPSGPPALIQRLSADDFFEDQAGDFWILAHSPRVALVKYERRTGGLVEYPIGVGAARVDSGRLLEDGINGIWVPSSQGMLYFDRRAERFTQIFQHDDTNPHSLSDNSVARIYRDRAGLLWVATRDGGLNILNFQQEQFGHYRHRPGDANSLSPGKVTAMHEDTNGVLWVGSFPRALDRLDRKTGEVTHFLPGPPNGNSIGRGNELNCVYKDSRGYLWVGGMGAGLDRFDERTGRFKHYRHNPADPHSLMTNDVVRLYEDANGDLWVGQFGGVSRLDTLTDRFTNYRPGPPGSTSLEYTISAFHRDRSGTLWLGTWSGALSRFDDRNNTFVNSAVERGKPGRLQGGSIFAIHEDGAGNLWLATSQGVYRYDRRRDTFTQYTEIQGLPTMDVMGVLADRAGRLWFSTKKGISRFDPRTETFRTYDVSDGLWGNDFTQSCYQQGRSGEMFFCGRHGITVFSPEAIRDNPYIPPVVITSLKIFNEAPPIGNKSELHKAIPYVDSLTLPYRKNVFSLDFAALSYANSHKNRYRYKLENFDGGWREAASRAPMATYTNLDPGRYIFRVQGSNSDGVWNEEGVSLPILITPPWYRTDLFVASCIATGVLFLWGLYRLRMYQITREFAAQLDGRVDERLRVARELHDTLLQSFQALVIHLQAARNMVASNRDGAMRVFDDALDLGAKAIVEAREAIQAMRSSTGGANDLAHALEALGHELASEGSPQLRVTLEGPPKNIQPDSAREVYRIACEAIRNAFRHAQATTIEAQIAFGESLRVCIRDNGKGVDSAVAKDGRSGHYGIVGMRERAMRIGGKLDISSAPGAGTEIVLTIPGPIAFRESASGAVIRLFHRKDSGEKGKSARTP
ncbi:MAG: two-component regulator propeller domain-containing protein [Bryobacteraceae bacterium]|nr:two-component regulator propeller domain-containing protein [Bryobacteraceae bacterium]